MRSLNPDPFNRIFNDPCVRPWMGYGLEPKDLSPVVGNPANVCFLTPNQDGGYIVAHLTEQTYVAHTLALPSARGKPMLKLMKDGFAYMFAATCCEEIVTTCPDENPAGARWAEIAGFVETHRREGHFPMADSLVGASYRSLLYRDWVLRHEPNRAAGQAFHEQLHAAGHELATHPEDPVHDAWVGATILGCRAGNVRKAIRLFNRWALQTGYFPSAIVSEIPPIVDTGDALIGLVGGEVRVLHIKGSEALPDALG